MREHTPINNYTYSSSRYCKENVCETDRQTDRQKGRKTDRHTYEEYGVGEEGQTTRQIGRKADIQTKTMG